jgi:glycosyltransferase involved in cell wall biosynthesis
MDIIITGQQAWDVEIGSNCKNIALEFSKKHRVLYVNAPLDRISLMKSGDDPKVIHRKRVINGQQNGLEQINKNLWVLYPDRMIESINWIPSQTIFNLFNRRNNKIFAGSIKRAIRQLDFRNFVHFNDNDMFRSFYIKDFLKPKLSIYYSRDFMLAVDYWKKHGTQLEPRLIAKSDICVANSTYLADYCRKYNPRSYYVGQGCDLEIFNNGIGASEPDDIAKIAQPRIGYVGALQTLRLDMDLLIHLAISRPDWHIVLVGPEDEGFKISRLHELPNVHFLGSKDGSQLPQYINAFDVCLNPQLLNEVTIGNYPRKIDEYLAMGKPTVATKTDAMGVFADHVYLGETKEDYVTLVSKALRENTPEKAEARRNFASAHTWENSVGDIYKAIDAYALD